MGTNYYIKPKDTTCPHSDHWIHLGKSSMGMRFMFQAYPNGYHFCDSEIPTWPVVDYPSWLRLLDLGEAYDEYDHRINKPFIRDMIQRKRLQPAPITPPDYLDEGDHWFIRGEFS